MMSPRPHADVRNGLTLLEVLVALGVFLVSFVALSQLIKMSGDRAVETQQQLQASRLCQSKMAEVIGGAMPLTSQSAVPFDEDPAWLWSLDCEQSNYPNLWNVSVQVSRQQARGTQVICTLSEMVLDPQIHGSLQDLPPGGSTSDNSSSGGSSSSSSSSSTTTMGGN
jgi:type II secretion system protein I